MGNDLFNGLHTCKSNKTYMEKPLCLIAYAKSLRKNNLAWFISAFACGFARLPAPAKHRRNAFAAKVGTALFTKSLHPKKKRCSNVYDVLLFEVNFTYRNIDDSTLLNVNIISNKMLCFALFSKDDAALLNIHYMSLVRKLGSCFFKNKGPWTIPMAQNEKRLALLQIPTNLKPLNLDFDKNRPKMKVLNSYHSEQCSNSSGSLLAPVLYLVFWNAILHRYVKAVSKNKQLGLPHAYKSAQIVDGKHTLWW